MAQAPAGTQLAPRPMFMRPPAPPPPQQIIVRRGNSSALKNKLEDAQEALKRARAAAKDKVDATEASLLTGVVVGSVVHGYARGSGYTQIAGFDVGLVVGAGALIAAQMLPRGSHQRALVMGVGGGMAAAVISEYAEGFALESGSKS